MEDGSREKDIEPKKLFVGGLSWNTTKQSMEAYFSQFGEVSDCVVMKENDKPRGFGFVTFCEEESAVRALSRKEHILDEKKVDPKHATVKGKNVQFKLFMGGLHSDSTEESVKRYFSDILIPGTDTKIKVVSVEIKRTEDQESKRFGFLQVDNEACMTTLLQGRESFKYNIDGKMVELKRANPQVNKKAHQAQIGAAQQSMAAQQAMLYSGQGSYYHHQHPSFYERGNNQYTSSNYIPYGYAQQQHANYSNYAQPNSHSSYYSGNTSNHYSGRGYSGQQQMGNYHSEPSYTQTSSSFTGNDSYPNSSVMNYGYPPTYPPYGNEQTSGGSPSSYPRAGFGGQGTSGTSSHSNYSGYGSR